MELRQADKPPVKIFEDKNFAKNGERRKRISESEGWWKDAISYLVRKRRFPEENS